jgi:WD40 repeat protein
MAFLGSPELMATGSDDGTVILRDYATKEMIQIYYFPVEGAKGAILSVALSPDGRLIAMGGQDPKPHSGPLEHVPHVWSLKSQELLYFIRGHTQTVTAIQFSPVGHVLLTASKDGTACIWRASNGELLQTLDEPRIGVTAAAFSVDGERVILGYEDGTVRIFGPEAPSTPSKSRKKA